MADAQALMDVLSYKRAVLEQLLTVASIFGGFAVTGVITLRNETRYGIEHTIGFAAMAVAAIAFIFATALDAIWLPISHNVQASSADAVRAVIAAGDGVAWAVIGGTAALAVAVALIGFARSRAMGIFVLLATGAAGAAFVSIVWTLTRSL